LSGAATATTLTCLAGFFVAWLLVQNRFGSLLSGLSFLKILPGSLLLYFVPRLWPVSGWSLVPFGLGLFGIYILLLIIFKEIQAEDLDLFRNLWLSMVKKNP
jgi:hypothetical protein